MYEYIQGPSTQIPDPRVLLPGIAPGKHMGGVRKVLWALSQYSIRALSWVLAGNAVSLLQPWKTI